MRFIKILEKYCIVIELHCFYILKQQNQLTVQQFLMLNNLLNASQASSIEHGVHCAEGNPWHSVWVTRKRCLRTQALVWNDHTITHTPMYCDVAQRRVQPPPRGGLQMNCNPPRRLVGVTVAAARGGGHVGPQTLPPWVDNGELIPPVHQIAPKWRPWHRPWGPWGPREVHKRWPINAKREESSRPPVHFRSPRRARPRRRLEPKT